MNFRLEFSTEARNILVHLQEVDPKKYNNVIVDTYNRSKLHV
jgi:hypothetical protein